MALRLHDLKSKYAIWRVSLPHPGRGCTISAVSADRKQKLKIYLHCSFQQSGDRTIQRWNLTHTPPSYAVTTYVQLITNSISPTFKRLADYLPVELTRATFAECGVHGDNVNMLFVFAPSEMQFPEEASRKRWKPSHYDEVSTQSLSLESLSQDLVQLFDTNQHSDVLLKCGESSFPVHKNILATRSDVFAAMFHHDMKESKTGVVDIEDLDSFVLLLFVKYLYSGKVEEMNMDKAIQLCQVAERYAVHSLKEYCGSFMSGNLSTEEICKILVVADQVGDSKLLEAATSFAAQQEEFLKTEEWKNFAEQYPGINSEVFLKFIHK